MKLGEKIIDIRNKRGLTQDDFAEELFVTRQTVSNWENSKCFPDIETLILLSDKFDVSLDVLLKDDVQLVKTIDKTVRASKTNKRISVSLFVCMVIMLISFWVIYKSVLVYIYYLNEEPRVQELINNLETVTLKSHKSGSNSKYGKLNFFVPEELEESDHDFYGVASENERFYVENDKRMIWINKGLIDDEFLEDSKFIFKFGFNYAKLMRKNKIVTGNELITYFKEHRDDVINVFWSKNHMQIDYLARSFVNNIAVCSNLDDIFFIINLDDLEGNIHINGEYYVVSLYRGGEFYILRYRHDKFSLDEVFEMLKNIYLED